MASSVPAPSGSVITVASSSSSAATAAVCGTGLPCAACKFLRRKCQRDCVFAPYFPPDNPQKFVHVHRVFGASNVTKLLNELHPFQREDAVNSLAYEADMRLRDPVYGCVGVISILQHNLRQLQQDLARAKYELSKYQAAAAASASTAAPNGPQAMAEFIGNAMPNGAHNFINIGHSAPLGSLGGSATVLGQEQFANAQMLSRSYDGEPIARLGINGGYEFGYSTAMGGSGAVSGLGTLGVSPFLKSGTAGGDEKPKRRSVGGPCDRSIHLHQSLPGQSATIWKCKSSLVSVAVGNKEKKQSVDNEEFADAVKSTVYPEANPGIYEQVMNIPGFTREQLMFGLTYFIDNKGPAQAFVQMSDGEKVLWLMQFLGKHNIM